MDARSFNRYLDPLKRRTRLMATRSVLDRVDNSGGRQTVQIHRYGGMDGDTGIERFQNYGFASWPKQGAESVDLALGGNGAHRVTICVDDRRFYFRVTDEGDVAVYDDRGQYAWLSATGIKVSSPLGIDAETTQTLRLAGKVVQIHATDEFRFDVNGHGQVWLPTKVDTWQTGEVAGTAHPITPPEVPE
ncbi:MAG TPA: phage baseplate assembly protein [Stellaceae bacterium]|jgi:phage gp45-like